MNSQFLDSKGRPLVVVTGMGLVTSLGWGRTECWQRLIAGHSGIAQISRFPTDGLRTTIAGTIPTRNGAAYSAYTHSLDIAEAAADEAIRQAAIGTPGRFPGPLFIATPPSELEWPQLTRLYQQRDSLDVTGYHRLLAAARTRQSDNLHPHVAFASIANAVQLSFGTTGEPLSICTACASGSSTIQMAMERLRRGEADAALCVGTDATVHPEGLVRFSLLSALSTRNDPPQLHHAHSPNLATDLSLPKALAQSLSKHINTPRRAARNHLASYLAQGKRLIATIAHAQSLTDPPLLAP